MKPRKPLLRPTKPLARSTKRIERKPITRKPTKRAKDKKKAMDDAKDFYFELSDRPAEMRKTRANCQLCNGTIWRDDCAAHHKIKRSLWATAAKFEIAVCGTADDKRNLVIIHHRCHDKLHLETPESIAELNRVRLSEANALNGKFIR